MKKVIALVAAIIMIAGFSSSVFAQAVVSAAGSAKLITPLTITQTAPLHFGTLAAGLSTGNVILTLAGARSSDGGVNLSTLGTPHSVATFSIAGNPSTSYALTVAATFVVSNGATNNMTVTTTNSGLTGTLDGGGAATLTVAGTLAVGISQAPGMYNGNFPVTVAYN